MAAAALTAYRGRRARRAKVTASAAWRLLVLTALAYAAMMLLGGTAQADECPESGCSTQQPTDLVTTLTTTAEGVTRGTQTLVGTTTETVTRTTQTLAGRQPAADVPAPLAQTAAPEAGSAQTATAEAVGLAEAPAVDTPQPEPAVVLTLPSLEETVMPVATAGAELVDATAAALTTVTAEVEIPALAQVTAALVDTVDSTTDDLLALAGTTTRIADQDVVMLTASLDPVLPSLAGLGGGVDVASAAGGSARTGAVAGGDSAPTAWLPETGTTPAMFTAMPIDATARPLSTSPGGPAVPPPDSHDLTVVQSAPDTVGVMTVPVSGAGSIATGSTSGGPSAPAGGPELSKCTIAGFRRTDFSAAPRAAAPARPLPGSPLDDPSFSPD